MDYEEVMNLTAVANATSAVTQEESLKYIAHEIIFLICCTVAFFADIAIIYTILYFKQMRDLPYLLVANWAIVDLLALVVTPAGYRLVSIIDHFSLPAHFVCVLLQMGLTFHFMTIVSVFVVLVDWCVAAYLPKFSKNVRVYYKFVLGLNWIALIICIIVLCDQCPTYKYNKTAGHIGFITLFGLLICIVVVRFVNMIKKHKGQPVEYSKLTLHLCTAFMVCYVLAISNFLLVDVFRARHPMFQVISLCGIFCNSIVILTILYFCDKRFQMHLQKGLQCKRRITRNSVSGSDNYENDPFSEVSFHCPTEQLLTNN